MKVTVCELNNESGDFAERWGRLMAHVHAEKPDLVLLPEMIFSPWFPGTRPFELQSWKDAVRMHSERENWLDGFGEGVGVLGSRPVDRGETRLNEAFIWEAKEGFRTVRAKQYLPDEEGFWEASWYARGKDAFQTVRFDRLRIGILICTELWFFQHARTFGREGVHLIAHPRASGRSTVDRWLVAGRAAAIVSGSYCISSNRSGLQQSGVEFGGVGWIIGPEGDLMGVTSEERPFLTLDLDIEVAEQAKTTYPRYVIDG